MAKKTKNVTNILPDKPINTKREDVLAKQALEEEFNYLYVHTSDDFSGYETEEVLEYDSMSCYE